MTVNTLWASALYETTPGWVEVRAIHAEAKPRVRWAKTFDLLEGVVDDLAAQGEGWNIYSGVATRKDRARPGHKEDVQAARAFWIDYDLSGEPGEQDEFESRLASLPIQASMLVSSGGGYHAYWLLEEPFELRDAKRRRWFEQVLKGLQVHARSDARVVDVARIMRIPGTTNWPDPKKAAKGRVAAACEVVQFEGHVYAPEDFHEIAERGAEEMQRAAGEVEQAEWMRETSLPEPVRSVLESSNMARRLFVRARDVLKGVDASDSAMDFAFVSELLKHPTLTKADILTAARLSRLRGGNPEKAERSDYLERTYAAALGRKRYESQRREEEVASSDTASRLRQLIRNPAAERKSAIFEQPFSLNVEPTHRFPTGVDEIDTALHGGCYGFTVVAGPKGVGKSTLLLSTTLTACQSGWEVAYFDGENAGNVFNRRVLGYFRGTPAHEIEKKIRRMRRFYVHSGVTDDELVEWACSAVRRDTERLLIVLDSFNTILSKMCMGQRAQYWERYHELLLWVNDMRVESQGAIAVMVASEMNPRGEASGRTIEYIDDVELTVTPKRKPGVIALTVEKTRETKKPDAFDMSLTEDYHLVPFEDDPAPSGDGDDDHGDGFGRRDWWDA